MSTATATPAAPPARGRFPFRPPPHATPAQLDAIRQAADDAISGVDAAIIGAARRLYPFDDATADDCGQAVRMHLWRTSLPRFDARRGAKLSTYLIACIPSAARAYRLAQRPGAGARSFWRRPHEQMPVDCPDHRRQQPDEAVEALAEALQRHGQAMFHLPEEQALFAAIIAHPDWKPYRIAVACGRGERAVRVFVGRLAAWLRNLDPAEYADVARFVNAEMVKC